MYLRASEMSKQAWSEAVKTNNLEEHMLLIVDSAEGLRLREEALRLQEEGLQEEGLREEGLREEGLREEALREEGLSLPYLQTILLVP